MGSVRLGNFLGKSFIKKFLKSLGKPVKDSGLSLRFLPKSAQKVGC